MTYAKDFLLEVAAIANSCNDFSLERLVSELIKIKDNKGTLYIIGLGGSAANATHMSADLRKLCRIDAMSLDNISELTARANDEGWETIFDGFSFHENDGLFILSVGGGTSVVSTPLVRAIDRAKESGTAVLGIVGPHGGYTAAYGDCVIKVPCEFNPTPYTEAFQAVIWHYIVSHPLLQKNSTKWV